MHTGHTTWKPTEIRPGNEITLEDCHDLLQIIADVDIPRGTHLRINVRGTAVILTNATVSSESDQIPVQGTVHHIEMLIDRTSIETFINGGQISVSECYMPANDLVTISSSGGTTIMQTMHVFRLNSAW